MPDPAILRAAGISMRGFYRGTGPRRECVVCGERGGHHATACALVALEAQICAVVGGLALYVTLTAELLEALERLVHGDDGEG